MTLCRLAERDETVDSREVMNHPGPIIPTDQIERKDCQWQDIGSGTFARTFTQVERLVTTTRGGPPISDVHRRTVWSLSRGKVIDDCIVNDVPDEILNRRLEQTDDIRVELVMKGAEAMYSREGPEVAELYSQPRTAQEAATYCKDGVELQFLEVSTWRDATPPPAGRGILRFRRFRAELRSL